MDPYDHIAALYDLEHDDFQDDLDFYRSIVRDGPVLEVGSGTGRLMAALLADGHEVWGIDPSSAMIERARDRLIDYPHAHLVCQDVVYLELATRFRVAILPLNLLFHLGALEAQSAALRMIRRHLVDGGLLLVDLSSPLTMADRGAAGEVRKRFSRLGESGSVDGFSAAWDDEAEQRITLHVWYDSARPGGTVSRVETHFELRYLYRFECELLLGAAGFRVTQSVRLIRS